MRWRRPPVAPDCAVVVQEPHGRRRRLTTASAEVVVKPSDGVLEVLRRGACRGLCRMGKASSTRGGGRKGNKRFYHVGAFRDFRRKMSLKSVTTAVVQQYHFEHHPAAAASTYMLPYTAQSIAAAAEMEIHTVAEQQRQCRQSLTTRRQQCGTRRWAAAAANTCCRSLMLLRGACTYISDRSRQTHSARTQHGQSGPLERQSKAVYPA